MDWRILVRASGVRLRDRCAQTDGDVVREVIAADRHDDGMPDRTVVIDRDIRFAATNIDEHCHRVLLVFSQYRFRDRYRFATVSPTRSAAIDGGTIF
jgi:hypothetical protein